MSAPPNYPDQWSARYSERFMDPSVIAAYVHRPPYSDALLDFLTRLITDEPRAVLDVGCGPGNLARPLAQRVARVDAVDISPGMIALGRSLPGGDDPRLHWYVGRAEDAPLQPPYALITAGSSLHWMQWEDLLPRFADALTPNGMLAIVGNFDAPAPWREAMRAIIPRYSLNHGFKPIEIDDELESRGLFVKHGREDLAPTPFMQSVDDFIEWMHSMSSFSRDVMTPDAVAGFDAEVRAALAPHATDGQVESGVVATIIWGKPLRKQRATSNEQ